MKTAVYDSIPEVCELHYSKPFAIIVLVLTTISLCSSALSIVGFAVLLHVNLWFGVLVVATIFLPIYYIVVPMLFIRDPVVVFDARGVSDIRQKESFVCWEDIEEITLGGGNGCHLCFKFRSREKAREYIGRAYLLRTVFRRLYFLSDWNINTVTLRITRMDALRLALFFRKRSIHQKAGGIDKKSRRVHWVNGNQ